MTMKEGFLWCVAVRFGESEERFICEDEGVFFC